MSDQPEPTVSEQPAPAQPAELTPTPFPFGPVVGGVVALVLLAGLVWFVVTAWQDDGTLVPVTGRVTLQGQPLDNGFILVHYGSSDAFGVSPIDSQGKFDLVTDGNHGARLGTHRVVIKGMTRSIPPTPTVHSRYGERSTTPFTMKVTRDGENSFEFDVESP